MRQIKGKLVFLRVSGEFELLRVRVIGVQHYLQRCSKCGVLLLEYEQPTTNIDPLGSRLFTVLCKHLFLEHKKPLRRTHRSLHTAASVRFAEQHFRQAKPTSISRMELKEKFKTLVIRLVMLSVYMTSGAAIFSVIEQDRDDGSKFTQELNEVKKNMSRQFNASMEVVNTLIQTLEQLLQENRRNCKFQHNDWNYYQSLYFVGSVTTTIGE